jgi:1-aminocyclopropane-1-carboxylate deaminase
MIIYEPIVQTVSLNGIACDILRLDLIHKKVSGNKWFKLKYNLQKAKELGKSTVVTMGGAFSNHIVATAAACKALGFKSIGIIRGESVMNDTLCNAAANGMQFYFINRHAYSVLRDEKALEEYSRNFGDVYIIPEGGNNKEGMSGCAEIIPPEFNHHYIFCACGTGATYAGIVSTARIHQVITGISVLKGENKLPRNVMDFHALRENGLFICGNEVLAEAVITKHNILNAYSFSGYAKCDEPLLRFKSAFEWEHGIVLDHVYNVKLFYAVNDLLKKGKIALQKKILIVHSGGLQGNAAFERRYHLTPAR